MEEANPTVVELASLAKEIGTDLNVDWATLNVSEDQAYTIMATNVFTQFDAMENEEEAAVVALATIVKLLVENLILRSATGNNT
jgi:hypothetical protein